MENGFLYQIADLAVSTDRSLGHNAETFSGLVRNPSHHPYHRLFRRTDSAFLNKEFFPPFPALISLIRWPANQIGHFKNKLEKVSSSQKKYIFHLQRYPDGTQSPEILDNCGWVVGWGGAGVWVTTWTHKEIQLLYTKRFHQALPASPE